MSAARTRLVLLRPDGTDSTRSPWAARRDTARLAARFPARYSTGAPAYRIEVQPEPGPPATKPLTHGAAVDAADDAVAAVIDASPAARSVDVARAVRDLLINDPELLAAYVRAASVDVEHRAAVNLSGTGAVQERRVTLTLPWERL